MYDTRQITALLLLQAVIEELGNDGLPLPPPGARLVLNQEAARDALLPRRSGGMVLMQHALGRQEAHGDPAYAAATAHLPLPDPQLDVAIR